MSTRKTLALTALALFLATCSSNKPRPDITLESEQPDTDIALPAASHNSQLKLPIGNHWNTWQCREQRPGDNPATYENGQIAFHSDGQNAVLSRPASATILLSGCRP